MITAYQFLNNKKDLKPLAFYDYVRCYTNASRGSLLSHKIHSLVLRHNQKCTSFRIHPDSGLVLFCAHKPLQIGCVGFVWRCRVLFSTNFFARHRAKQDASGFLAAHRFNHQPDSQREPPTKRIALAEVHKLCAVVFDFLKYGVLLLRQRSGQFLLYSVTVLTSAGEVISLTSSSAVELSAVAFSELPDEQPESIKVDDTARDKIRMIPMIRIIVFFIQ